MDVKRMVLRLPGLFLPIFVAFFCFTASSPPSAEAASVLVTMDRLAHPNEEVDLGAALLRKGPIGYRIEPVSGEVVRFMVNGEVLGERITNHLGMASLPFKTGEPGKIEVETSLKTERRFKPDRLNGTVWVFGEDRPFLLIEIDYTLLDAKRIDYAVGFETGVRFAEGAKSALERLGSLYRIVYVTYQRGTIAPSLRKALVDGGLPEAPLILVDVGNRRKEKEDQRRALLDGLRREWNNVVLGVTHERIATGTFAEHGMLPVLFDRDGENGDDSEDALPVMRGLSWGGIAQELEKESYLKKKSVTDMIEGVLAETSKRGKGEKEDE